MKGTNWKGIICVLSAVIIMIVGINWLKNRDESSGYIPDDLADEITGLMEPNYGSFVEKGYVIGRTYYNDWLGLTVDFPEGYEMADEGTIATLETNNCDVGFLVIDNNSKSRIAMLFEELPSEGNFSVEDYINYTAEEVIAKGSGVEVKQVGEMYDIMVGDKLFKTALYDLSATAYWRFSVYEQEGKICCIMMFYQYSEDSKMIDFLLDM